MGEVEGLVRARLFGGGAVAVHDHHRQRGRADLQRVQRCFRQRADEQQQPKLAVRLAHEDAATRPAYCGLGETGHAGESRVVVLLLAPVSILV